VDVIVKLGDMIQWKIYNPRSPLDAIAARWAVQQEQAGTNLFPTGNVNLGVADFDIRLKSSATPEDELDRAGMPAAQAADLEPVELDAVDAVVPDEEPDFVVAIRS